MLKEKKSNSKRKKNKSIRNSLLKNRSLLTIKGSRSSQIGASKRSRFFSPSLIRFMYLMMKQIFGVVCRWKNTSR